MIIILENMGLVKNQPRKDQKRIKYQREKRKTKLAS